MPYRGFTELAPLSGHHPRWARFDPGWYARAYPDSAASVGQDAGALRDFYLDMGQHRGDSPNPFFDERFYLLTCPGAVRAIRHGEASSGFHHYCRSGFRDRAPHWLFDPHAYRAGSPALTDAALARTGFANLYDHYLEIGCREPRPSHFMLDPDWYFAHLPPTEVESARRQGAYIYLLSVPGPEVSASPHLDPAWYRGRYPDVAAEVEAGVWRSALHHYLANATPGDYDPNPYFSEADYRVRYPDIARVVDAGTYRNSYIHFVQHGARERRVPAPLVDLNHYLRRNPSVQEDLDAGLASDPFAHFLRFGVPRNLSAAPPVEDIVPEVTFKRVFRAKAEQAMPIWARMKLDFATTGTPDLSVIVVMHGLLALTMQTLASLRSNYRGNVELVLIDSGSGPDDGIARIGAYVTGARILRFATNIGYVRACNAGLTVARAPRILLLNNDVELAAGAVDLALRRLDADPTIGAVGGKVVRSNGVLQEAGCIVWRDGSTSGYMRDAWPLAPEANFVRDVDFCSAVFLMCRADLLRALGGFDDAYAPAYFEDTDLCVRMRLAGHRVVYDPAVVIHHLEFGSSPAANAARAQMVRGRETFQRIHAGFLETRPMQAASSLLMARSVENDRRPVLFVLAECPVRLAGNGAARILAIVGAMAAAGHQVTIYPLDGNAWDAATLYCDVPDTVEVMHDRGIDRLPEFLQARSGYYGTIWIDRAGNLNRVVETLEAHGLAWPDVARIVLSVRPLRAMDDPGVVRHALRHAQRCWRIVVASERDAAAIGAEGLPPVQAIPYVPPFRPTAADWTDRTGLLFVGSMHSRDPGNYDALVWYIDAVLPLLARELGEGARTTVIGYADDDSERWELSNHPLVIARGTVDDLTPAYESHRVFVAPAIRAGSAGYRVQEAAAAGMPVVAGQLLADALDWTPGQDLLTAGADDAAGFADRIVSLYRNETQWRALRETAGQRLSRDADPTVFAARVLALLG
ncbi:MAG: glycosyltransferase [Acetobacteraceae bacterium]